MRPARLLICLLVVSGGLGAALLLVPRAVRSLRSLTVPALTLPRTTALPHRTEQAVRAPAARSPNPRRRGPARSTSRTARANRSFGAGRLAFPARAGRHRGCRRRSADRRGGAVARAPPRSPAPVTDLRAVRAPPLHARSGQGPGPRGHDRAGREHRPRLARRAPAQRAALCSARADLRGRGRQRRAAGDGVVDQHPVRAENGERARRRDQRRLPRRQTRPHPRRAAAAASGRAARARVRDAVSQGAKLRVLADRRGRRRRRPRRSSRSHAPRSRSRRPRSFASS